jgi:hypothetical protein
MPDVAAGSSWYRQARWTAVAGADEGSSPVLRWGQRPFTPYLASVVAGRAVLGLWGGTRPRSAGLAMPDNLWYNGKRRQAIVASQKRADPDVLEHAGPGELNRAVTETAPVASGVSRTYRYPPRKSTRD